MLILYSLYDAVIPVVIDSVISVGIDAVFPVIDTTLCHVIDSLFHRCCDPRCYQWRDSSCDRCFGIDAIHVIDAVISIDTNDDTLML